MSVDFFTSCTLIFKIAEKYTFRARVNTETIKRNEAGRLSF